MPWLVNLLCDETVVQTYYHGALTGDELKAACRETMVVARRVNSCRYLTDCRGLEPGGHSLADLYFLVDYLVDEGLDKESSREAVIADAHGEMAEKIEFWENTMVNRGFDVRRFSEIDAALVWLSR